MKKNEKYFLLILFFLISCCTIGSEEKYQYELLIKPSDNLSAKDFESILKEYDLIKIEEIREINIIKAKFKKPISKSRLESIMLKLNNSQKINFVEKDEKLKAIEK